jgi:hypothetical protein
MKGAEITPLNRRESGEAVNGKSARADVAVSKPKDHLFLLA